MQSALDTLLAAVQYVETQDDETTQERATSSAGANTTSGAHYQTAAATPGENNPGAVGAATPQGGNNTLSPDQHLTHAHGMVMSNPIFPNSSKSFMQQLAQPVEENATAVTDGRKLSDEVKTFAVNEEKDKKDFVTMQVPNSVVLRPPVTTASPWNIAPMQHQQHPAGGFDLQQQQQKLQLQNTASAAADQYQFPTDPSHLVYKPNTIQTLNNNRIAAVAAGSGGEKVHVLECAPPPPPKVSYVGEQNHVFAAANNAAASAARVPTIHPSHGGETSSVSRMDQHQIHGGQIRQNWGERVVMPIGETSVIQQQPGVSGTPIGGGVGGAGKNDLHQYHQNPGAAIQQRMGEQQQQRSQQTRGGTSGSSRAQSLTHNQLEKNRRAHLKGCFEKLRENIPRLGQRRASNLTILKSALRHIETQHNQHENYKKTIQTLKDKNQLRNEYYERLYSSFVEEWGKEATDKYMEEATQRQKEDERRRSRTAPSSASIVIDDGHATASASEGEDEETQQRPPTTNKFAFLPPGRHPNSRYQPLARPTVRPSSPATHNNVPISSYRPRTPVIISNSQMPNVYVQKPVTMTTKTSTAAVGSNHYQQQPQQQVITTSYMVPQAPQPIVTATRMTNGVQGSQGQMVQIIHPQHTTTTPTTAAQSLGASGGIIRQGSASAVGPQQVVYLTMPASNYQGVQQHHHPLIPMQVKSSADGKPPQQQQIIHRVQAPQPRLRSIQYTQASGRSATPPPNNISSHPIQWCRGGSPMQSEFENQSSPMPPAVKEIKKPDIISGKLTPPLLVNQPVSIQQQQLALKVYHQAQQKSKEAAQAQAQAAVQPPTTQTTTPAASSESGTTTKSANSSPGQPRIVSLDYAGYDVKVKYLPNACIPVQYATPSTNSTPTSANTTTVQTSTGPDQGAVSSAAPTVPTPKTTTSPPTSSQPSTSTTSPSKPSKSRSSHQMTSLYVAASADNLGHSDPESDYESFAVKRAFCGNDVKNSDTTAVSTGGQTRGHFRKNWLRNNGVVSSVAFHQQQQQQKSDKAVVTPVPAAATTNNSRHISALKFHNNYQAVTTSPITTSSTVVTTNGGEAKHPTTCSPEKQSAVVTSTTTTTSPTKSSVENVVTTAVTSQSVTQHETTSTATTSTVATSTTTDQSSVKQVNSYALQPYTPSKPATTTGEETSQVASSQVENTQPKQQTVVQNVSKPTQMLTVATPQRQTSVSGVTTSTTMPQMILAPMQRPMMAGTAQTMHQVPQMQQVPTSGQPVTYQLLQASAMPPQMFAAQPQLNYVTVANNNTNEASSDNKNQQQQPQQQQQQPTLVAMNGMNGMVSFQQVLPVNVIMYQGSPSPGPNGQHMGQPIMVRTTDANKMLITQQQQQRKRGPSDDNQAQDDAARKRIKSTTTTQPTQMMGQHVVLPANTQGGNVMMAMGPSQGNGGYNIVGYPLVQGAGGQAMHVGFPAGAQLAVTPTTFMQPQQ